MALIAKILSKFDDSGIKKAKSSFGGLSKTIGAIGIGIGLKQLTDGLLDAAKAAAADEKSTRLLNIQLVRNANATEASVKENDAFIQSLSLATGIMDDDLRPSMAKFANVTGNVKEAQKLLTITLDGAAGSGKNQEKIANAVAKAYAGNTTSLKKMFPELSKSKDVLDDFAKTYKGLAEENADPFMKFNNSLDIVKEKLGVVVLPILIDFIDEISKPGGAIEVMGQFFDDLANPKSDVGKTFTEIKDAVGVAIENVKTFFSFFGGGDAVQGFKNIATALVQALPALIALKGIMLLASGGKAIANLITAMTAISGKSAIPTTTVPPVAPVGNPLATGLSWAKLLPMIGVGLAPKMNLTDNPNYKGFTGDKPSVFNPNAKPAPAVTTNVVINVTKADPKATVVALVKYLKENGKTLSGTDLRRALG